MSWQKIETAPSTRGEYLCVTTGCPWWPDKPWKPQVEILYFCQLGTWTNSEGIERTVTHWMPLPTPPEPPK